MALSLTEIIALRRLASVYRRILVLAVPAALAGCQESGDVLAPDSAGAPGEVSSTVAEAAPTDAIASLIATGRIASRARPPTKGRASSCRASASAKTPNRIASRSKPSA